MSSSREAPGTINDEKSPSFPGEARSQSAMAPRAIWSTRFESSGLPKYWGTSVAVVRDWAAVCLWRPRRRGVVALERTARWALRIPVPMLDTLARVDVKRLLQDGRRQLVMTGVELLDKLVPLIPPTDAKLTRFITAR